MYDILGAVAPTDVLALACLGELLPNCREINLEL